MKVEEGLLVEMIEASHEQKEDRAKWHLREAHEERGFMGIMGIRALSIVVSVSHVSLTFRSESGAEGSGLCSPDQCSSTVTRVT